ncbi:hypothetical protein BBJ28_00014141 [Nothophytophthora sp. Chile5]|nr:hypothetical protein BBJ28_00014141 [Nothophytophthora sp. Chile5]
MVNVLRTTSVLAAMAAATTVADAFKCTGINYNIRAGPDWATADVKCKPASQIATELATLKTVTDTIRLYSLTDCEQATAVVPVAIAAGLQIELGMWVDSATSSFEAEKAAFETLLATGVVTTDNIVGIHVGSEAVYRGDVTASVAISNLEEIRTLCTANSGAADVPLTIADIGDIYTEYPEMIEAVDYVSANYFPFWEKTAIDGAADFFYERFEALVTTASTYSKEVIVGETGWASDGVDADASAATAANAAKYFYDFYTLAEEKDLMYFYFSAFDEPWKLATLEANETVEAYFGLFTQEGVLKDAISAEFDNSTSTSTDGSSSDDTATITVGDDSQTSSSSDATTADATTSDDSTSAATTSDDSTSAATTSAATTLDATTTSDDTTSAATTISDATTSDDTTSTSTSTTTAATTSGKDCAISPRSSLWLQMADETSSQPTTATLAPGSERPDYRGKCLYKTGKCLNERALKTSGAAHNLCDEHRSRQNEHQRKLDAKNRVTKKERRNSTGKLPTAAAAPRERTPRFSPYPTTGGANPVVSKRRSLPAASAAMADTSDDTDSAGGLETGMSIASAAAAATATAIANLAPAASPGLLGLASSASTAHTPVVATSSGGVVYLPNGPQPPQLSYPFVMQDFDGIVVPLPSYLEGQERVEFRSRIYQKVLDFISEECILRFGAKIEPAAAVAAPVAAEALVTTETIEAAPEPEPRTADGPTESSSARRQDSSVLDVKQTTPAETRAVHSSKKVRSHALAGAAHVD